MSEEITVTIKLGDGSRNDSAPWIVHRAPSAGAITAQLEQMYGVEINEHNTETSVAELAIEASIKIRAAYQVMTGMGATRATGNSKGNGQVKPPAAAVNKKKPDRAAELAEEVAQLTTPEAVRAWLNEHRAELRKHTQVITVARAKFDSFKTPDNSKENAND